MRGGTIAFERTLQVEPRQFGVKSLQILKFVKIVTLVAFECLFSVAVELDKTREVLCLVDKRVRVVGATEYRLQYTGTGTHAPADKKGRHARAIPFPYRQIYFRY